MTIETSVESVILDKLDIKESSSSVFPKNNRNLDLQNEDAFPSLSSNSSKKSMPIMSYSKMSTVKKSSTPPARSSVSNFTDRLEIPYQLQARQTPFGKQSSPSDICKEVMSKHSVSIEISTNRKNGLMTCLITGKQNNVIAARHQLSRLLTIQVKAELPIPSNVRPHLVGKKGANLKALMSRTFTSISLPARKKTDDDVEESDEEEDVVVTITGDAESVALAKKEIEELLASRAAKFTQKLNIDTEFQQFVAGPNNSNIEKLQEEFNVRIHVPPFDPSNAKKNPICDIVVVGEKSDVQSAISRISENYETLKRSINTISISVRKKQHRFIVGPKGSSLQEIFAKTGCFVDIPPQTDPSDSVNVRGPDAMLTLALQMVLEKANSILIDEVNVTALLPVSTNSAVFIRFLYTKEKAKLKEIESEHDVNFYLPNQDKNAVPALIEIQAKTRASLEASSLKLQTFIRDLGRSLYIGVVDIPHGLHRYIVGKGGQNVQKVKANADWEGRLLDIVFFPESEESDDVLIVVKRGPSKSLQDNDKEAAALVTKIKDTILTDAQSLADLVSTVIRVDPKYHSRVIGTGGSTLKEILAPFEKAVSVRFPSSSAAAKSGKDDKADPSAITIRGLKDDVSKVSESIMKIVSELKHIEVMTSFSEEVAIDSAYTARLVGEDKHTAKLLSWTVKRIREQYAEGKLKLSTADKHFEKDLKGTFGLLYLTAELSDGKDKDILTIKGPKTFVAAAKTWIEHRYKELKDTAVETFDLFEEISQEAQSMLTQVKADVKASIFPRLIGKEGKNIKKMQEKHNVFVKFGRDENQGSEEDDVDEDDSAKDGEHSGEITIRGGRGGVLEAKKEIIGFVQNLIIGSFVLTFRLPKSTRATIVGRGGSNMAEFKAKYDVRIDINDILESEDEIEIVLEGPKSDCLAIQQAIEANVDDLVNAKTQEVPVPLVLHRLIIGIGGSTVRKFIDTHGGPDKVRINFPKTADSSPNELQSVSITANSKSLPEIVTAFKKLIVDVVSEASVPGADSTCQFKGVWEAKDKGAATLTFSLPRGDVAFIFGRSGDFAIGFMKKNGVTVWTNEYETPGSESVEVTLAGPADKQKVLEDLKKQIQGKKRDSKTVTIPEELLELLGNDNPHHSEQRSYLTELTRRVKSDHSVQLDLSSGASSGKASSTVTVRGESSRVEKAASSLNKLFDEWKSKKFLSKLSVPAAYRPHIIGRAGQTINRIRDESGATLDLSRSKNKDSADTLTIRGSTQDQIDKAISIVQKLLAEQAERLKRDQERAARREQESAVVSQPSTLARIDDEDQTTAPSGKTNGVSSYVPPGYVGKKSAADASASIKIASAVSVSSQPVDSFSFFSASPAQNSGWKEVGKKSVKAVVNGDSASASAPAEEHVAVDDVPGSSKNKKKKNKKKSDVPGAPSTPSPEDLAAISAVLAEKPAVPVKSAASSAPSKQPEADEWQEVPRKSRQPGQPSESAANASNEPASSEGKKKKKKSSGVAA